MQPISKEATFNSLMEFDKKTDVVDLDIQNIKQSMDACPEVLLELDKSLLSRLKVKLLSGGIAKNDDLIQKIDGVISTWRTDLRGLFKKISEQIKNYDLLKNLNENNKLVIYSYRRNGEYEMEIESTKETTWSELPWKAASQLGTFVAYQKFESITDVTGILKQMRAENFENVEKLVEELNDPNISLNDFEEGLSLLVAMQSALPDAILALDALKDFENTQSLDNERDALIELNELLNEQILVFNRRTIKKSGLNLPLDLVCDYSQGRISDVRREIKVWNLDEDNQGSLACAVICMKAVQSFFVKGLPESEKQIYEIIDLGVNQYKKDGYEGLVAFEEVLNHLSESEQALIKTIKLAEDDGVDSLAALSFEVVNEFSGKVSLYLDSILDGLMKKVMETDEKMCAVITTNSPKGTNATLVIMFDTDKKPYLFNSHGENYEGESKGASLLPFNTMHDLKGYLKKTFFKNEDGNFQLKILSS